MEGIYTENITIVTLIAGLIMEGIVKWRGLKSQGPLYCIGFTKLEATENK